MKSGRVPSGLAHLLPRRSCPSKILKTREMDKNPSSRQMAVERANAKSLQSRRESGLPEPLARRMIPESGCSRMAAVNQQPPVHQFGAFELDARSGELRKHGMKLRLQHQPL